MKPVHESRDTPSTRYPHSLSFEPSPYRPSWWLPGRHAQTIGGWVLRQGFRLPYRRLRLDTPDGDFLDIDIAPGPWEGWVQETFLEDPPFGTPVVPPRDLESSPRHPVGVVLILHGLEGCSRSGYVQWTGRNLIERDLLPVAMNMRSCSGEPNRRKRYYHSGDTDDIQFVIGMLRNRLPSLFIGAVGFSMGGNILLNYLAGTGRDSSVDIDGAVAVSVPFDLSGGVRQLERGFNRVYDRYFVDSLKEKFHRKEQKYGIGYELELLETITSLRGIDDHFTAPIHGFRDAEDYYSRCSSARVLDRIECPTLILHARDDPFQPDSLIPEHDLRENPRIQLELRSRGGHVGFINGRDPLNRWFWCERQIARYLNRLRTSPVAPENQSTTVPTAE